MWWQVTKSWTLSEILFFEGPHLELDNIAFLFSDFGLGLDPVLHRDFVFLPSNHLTVRVFGDVMSRRRKKPRLLQRVSQPQPYRHRASFHDSSSSISSRAYDEADAGENGPDEQTQQPLTLQWTRKSCLQSSVAHTYTGGPRGKKDNEASNTNEGSSPLNVFLL